MKVDVALQSYKKPESLVYTLLSLKKHCGEHIDTIYIQDDLSVPDVLGIYQSKYLADAMSPIKIVAVKNKKHGYMSKTMKINDKKAGPNNKYFENDNVRYQYAVNHTDKKYLMLIHDDIEFYDDVLKVYLDTMSSGKYALVGDLGQCNVCPYAKKGCTPEKINNHQYPSRMWPLNFRRPKKLPFIVYIRRDCRINEWCCLMDMDVNRMAAKKNILFGQFYFGSDIGCKYFDYVVQKTDYDVIDPCATTKDKYYKHCWQGFSGNSVWVDQGVGKGKYDPEMIIKRMKDMFDFDYSKCLKE